MKSTVVLYGANIASNFLEKSFDEKSAYERCVEWALNVENVQQVSVICDSQNRSSLEKLCLSPKIKYFEIDSFLCIDVIKAIYEAVKSCDADYAVFSWADCPFVNLEITKELLKIHLDYNAEYTFADGYPYGFTPEIIDKGTLAILCELCNGIQKDKALKPVERDSIFAVMSGDINSFEIETIVSPKDYRMLRFAFECSTKINYLACQNLYKIAKDKTDIIEFCDVAQKDEKVLKTVPAFFNIQISSKYNHDISYIPYKKLLKDSGKEFSDMTIESYTQIIKKIAQTNPCAVISLSCWGEPLCNKDFILFLEQTMKYPNLSLFIETDGLLVTEEIAKKVYEICADRIDWCVLLDATEKDLYSKIHNCSGEDFDKALNAIEILEKYFAHKVYPQMTRMKINEEQLESFYKYWKKTDSPSKGELIIQKYNWFAGLLSDEKSADLAPLQRCPCWHLRRDMVILSDASVPLCRERGFLNTCGNVLEQSIEDIFAKFDEELKTHIDGNYCQTCKACDEYYTFNF